MKLRGREPQRGCAGEGGSFRPQFYERAQPCQGWNDRNHRRPKVAAAATLGWRVQPRCGCVVPNDRYPFSIGTLICSAFLVFLSAFRYTRLMTLLEQSVG